MCAALYRLRKPVKKRERIGRTSNSMSLGLRLFTTFRTALRWIPPADPPPEGLATQIVHLFETPPQQRAFLRL
jgi:hypothetical protein